MHQTTLTGKSDFIARASKNARRQLTRHEQMLFDALKSATAPHCVFTPQWFYDDCIFDFYSEFLKIAIEVDGSSHGSPRGIAGDLIKGDIAKKRNIQIFRVTNEEVEASAIDVLKRLAVFVAERQDKSSKLFKRHANRVITAMGKL